MFRDIFGIVFIVTSIFDCWKYLWQAKAIIKIGTAKGQSRKFLNAAIFADISKLIYAFFIEDIFIFLSAAVALITMGYCWWQVYKFYPYKYRNLLNWKRPHILLYIWNSLTPNRIRKRL